MNNMDIQANANNYLEEKHKEFKKTAFALNIKAIDMFKEIVITENLFSVIGISLTCVKAVNIFSEEEKVSLREKVLAENVKDFSFKGLTSQRHQDFDNIKFLDSLNINI